MKRVLTVVPCLDEIDHLPGLIDQLLGDPANDLVVVADGGSRDGSREHVARRAKGEPRLVIMDNPDRLQSAGVNRAVARYGASKRWLARIDAHCRYPDLYVSTLLDAAARSGATSVVVPMRTVGNGGFQDAVAAAQNSRLGTGGSPHRSGGEGAYVDHGHHALMELRAFMDVGGYRDGMATNEDAELDLRLVENGARIWLEPRCTIDYFPRRTPLALFRQYFRYGRGRAMTTALHRVRLKPRQAAPLVVAPAVLAAFVAPLASGATSWWWVLLLPALLWAALCLAWGAAMALRQGRAVLAAGVAAMIMHLAWSAGFWTQALGRRVQDDLCLSEPDAYSSSTPNPKL